MFVGRIRMLVRYDGTDFAGSQIQPGKRTVQGTLKAELERLTGQPAALTFASRTDSGVHADGNVCAFDAELPFAPGRLAGVLNKRLPPDLRVRNSEPAAPDFNPRFEALSRTYVYRLYRSPDVPVDRQRYVWPCPGDWDGAAARSCLRLLPGRRAFHRFAAGTLSPEQAVCSVEEAAEEQSGLEIVWTLTANRFLRSMVCRLVGGIAAVARGRLGQAQFEAALAGTESLLFKPAPPRGLVLRAVSYPGASRESGEEQ